MNPAPRAGRAAVSSTAAAPSRCSRCTACSPASANTKSGGVIASAHLPLTPSDRANPAWNLWPSQTADVLATPHGAADRRPSVTA